MVILDAAIITTALLVGDTNVAVTSSNCQAISTSVIFQGANVAYKGWNKKIHTVDKDGNGRDFHLALDKTTNGIDSFVDIKIVCTSA